MILQKIKIVLLLALLLLFPASLFSQEASVVDSNVVVFNNYVAHIAAYRALPIETVLEQTARFLLGTPYVAHTLDQTNEEQLVVNLYQLDCVTYVENVLALSLAARSKNFSFDSFRDYLQLIRYRKGQLLDYASRLHYTSDWVFDNEESGVLRNISEQLSGVKETKQINFMSAHRSAYKQLAQDDGIYSEIVEIEKALNGRGGFYYVPKEAIAAQAAQIPHMAVVGVVTSIDGLDTSHVGFAYQKEGELFLIHASYTKMKVVVDSKTLSNYCLLEKGCKGIIVAKINDI